MTINQLYNLAVERLERAGYLHAKHEVSQLMAHLLKMDSAELITKFDKEVNDSHIQLIKKAVNLRLKGSPLSYITGVQEFFGEKFISDKRALIGRSETEQLIEKILPKLRKLPSLQPDFLEIGTGSGVIAITLKKFFPRAEITATDISKDALELAQDNANLHQVEINFLESDLFESVPRKKYNLIIANLPYVPSEKLRFVSKEILDWEPIAAVDGGQDGLKYLKPFIKEVSKYWAQRGLIALEIWHTHASELTKLINQFLPDAQTEIEKDLAGYDRFCLIER